MSSRPGTGFTIGNLVDEGMPGTPSVSRGDAEHTGQAQESPAAAVQRLVRAAHHLAGSYKVLGAMVVEVTGREYKDPEGAAKQWASNSMPPADVLVAIRRLFPQLSLDDYADQDEPGSVEVAPVDLPMRQLQREVARLRQRQALTLGVLLEVIAKARLPIDLRGRLAAAGDDADLAEIAREVESGS